MIAESRIAEDLPGGASAAVPRHVSVLIVGAGLSGIGAAVHLQRRCPSRSYAILEGRAASGGTWDLFRFPGIRSDSDMHTLGYGFRPWRGDKAIADGASILEYIRDTAREFGVDRKIHFQHRVKRATWSSDDARWAVDVEIGPAGAMRTDRVTCDFLFLCSGYYNYEHGYRPTWPGEERFRGTIVHPQFWPEHLNYRGKRVVVIGSGATAVTMVPALAREAAHVVMLQRSPTYIVARPAKDARADWLYRHLPVRLAYAMARWKNVLRMIYFRRLAAKKPKEFARFLISLAKQQVGPEFDVSKHLTPRYNPWDQRLCLVPDGDLFRALKAGTASIATDQIERFTETGIRLASGEELPADLVVTATGLDLRPAGGIQLVVDGSEVNVARTLTYKGLMFSDVPNLAVTMGYTSASWTLKSDLTAKYVCRLLNYMARKGHEICVPRRDPTEATGQLTLDLKSGYILRAADRLPRQGSKPPWRMHQNYALDVIALGLGRVNDGTMEFARRRA